MSRHLTAWIAGLAILTSLVVIEGTWAVEAYTSWPSRRTIAPTERIPATLRQVAPTVQPSPSPTLRKSGAQYPEDLTEMIANAAHLCGVSAGLMFRLVARESSMRQWDKQGRTLKSSSGALGLTQIKPGTARGISRTLSPHRPFDNLVLGSCYYRQMLDRFGGDQHRALIAYHNGPNGGRAIKGVQYADAIMEGESK